MSLKRLSLPLLALALAGCSDTSGSTGADTSLADGNQPGLTDTGAPATDVVTDDAVDVISHATDAVNRRRGPDVDERVDVGEPLPDVIEDVVADIAVTPDVTPDTGGPIDIGPVDAGPPPELPYVEHCSAPGGEWNVYDLQDPSCPDHLTLEPGQTQDVLLTGLVVTGVYSDQFFAQEQTGGPWSGISIFALNAKGDSFKQLALGDRVNVEGSYRDYFGLDQIYATTVTRIGGGQPAVPDSIPIAGLIATGGEWSEPYESVLVRVEGLSLVINTKPDCPHEFGEFMIDDNLRVDDMKTLSYVAHLGDELQHVTGVLNYGFGNFKLEPRIEPDLNLINPGGSAASKCIKTDCIEPADKPELGSLVVTEIMADPMGEDAPREWIEVQNRSEVAILVAGLTLKDCAFQVWMVPLATAVALPPGGFAVIGASTDMDVNGGVKVDAAWGPGFYLPNGEGAVLVYNPQGQLIDQARYASYEPWDFVSGHSLELIDPAADNQSVGNWKAGVKKYGAGGFGTPGAPNSAW